MANPTSNFGWQMPTNTDLVKDLPADFEVFGQAVDTSLMDLKGGTTGQVLSKASNTDMDFTWVAQDDSNAIQNTIVDAKGDLISATAADTPARLAVGTNGQFLQADSSTATGLKWATVSAAPVLLSTTSLSGTSTTVSSISQSYSNLIVIVDSMQVVSGGGGAYSFRVNGDTGNNYYQGTSTALSRWDVPVISALTTANNQFCQLTITSYSNSSYRKLSEIKATTNTSIAGPFFVWNSNDAINSITFRSNDNSTFNAGTIKIYGVA